MKYFLISIESLQKVIVYNIHIIQEKSVCRAFIFMPFENIRNIDPWWWQNVVMHTVHNSQFMLNSSHLYFTVHSAQFTVDCNVDCKVWTVNSKLWSMNCEQWSVNCEVLTVKYKLESVNYEAWRHHWAFLFT